MTPQRELMDALQRTEAALAAGDGEAANLAMAGGVDLCRRLHEAGVPIPAEEADGIRALAERCGVALAAFGKRLNAESFRDDNHRRGIQSYQDSLRGGGSRRGSR
jgi:hypothetical protein